jgi:hypothetical protein
MGMILSLAMIVDDDGQGIGWPRRGSRMSPIPAGVTHRRVDKMERDEIRRAAAPQPIPAASRMNDEDPQREGERRDEREEGPHSGSG